MKGQKAMTLAFVAIALVNVACTTHSRGGAKLAVPTNHAPDKEKEKLKITIGSKTFSAALADTPAAKEFKGMLPLGLKMAELNGNEKHAELPKALPTDAKPPGTIQEGDLLLYGDRSLVLFYKTFKSPYAYTRLGKVDDSTGLAAALGTGDVEVAFAAK